MATLYNDVKTKNAEVTTKAPLINARIARSEILYKGSTGVVDSSVDIKTYIKSVSVRQVLNTKQLAA